MIRRSGIFTIGLLLIGLVCPDTPLRAQRLVALAQEFPGLWAGKTAWADYDGDGDLDVALMGEMVDAQGRTQVLARVYANFSGGLFDEANAADAQLVGAYHGDLAWADYDGDGDLDLAVAGWDAGGEVSLRLYTNTGSGELDRVLRIDRVHVDANGLSVLAGVRYASVAWADYDGDGDLDLTVIGMTENGTSLTRLYVNDGGVLGVDEENSEVVVDVHNGDIAWGDYDNDGDLDLGISGENVTTTGGLGPVTEFYENEPAGILRLEPALTVQVPVKGGSLAWADYDGDGNLDLAVSGRAQDWSTVLSLYRNSPVGVLRVDDRFRISTARRISGALAWGDYDNDGDADLAAVGRTILSDYHGYVFRNDDGELSGVSPETSLSGVAMGDCAWGDHDGDGDLDLLVCGVDASGQRYTTLYENQGTTHANQPPAPPAQLHTPQVTSQSVLFSWSPGSDAESTALTYNLRVGTQEGSGDIVSGVTVPGPGNVGFKTSVALSRALAADTYYWNVQSVDGGFAGSSWLPQDGVLNVQQFVSSLQRLRALSEASMAWGDYDDDGDVDLVICGLNRSGNAQTLLYENSNGQLSLDTDSDLAALRNGDVAWGDFDGDGDLDLLLTGEDTFENKRSLLYRAEPVGGGYGLVLVGQFPSLGWSAADWGDYDGDGDLDLVLSGQSDDVKGGHNQARTLVFENTGELSFEETALSLVGVHNGDVCWVDYDADGDLDLALSGADTKGERIFALYRNQDASFISVEVNIDGVESSSMAWGDLDGDGRPDLALSGIGDGGLVTQVYRNTAADGFVPVGGLDLPGIRGGCLIWADYDNDQDQDLILSGNDGQGPVLKVFANTGVSLEAENISVLTGVDFSAVSLSDYDADGDLDLFSAGRGADFVPSSAVNDNLEAQFNPNRPPEAPLLEGAVVAADSVRLSWAAATDEFDATAASLTYSVRVGTAPGLGDVVSGNTPVGPGNCGQTLFRRLHGLASGRYYWSARTVDDGWACSPWAPPQSFIVDTVPPVIDDVSMTANELGIGQTVTLAVAFYDAHSGMSSTAEPRVSAEIDGQSFPFQTLQFTGVNWSGALTITAEMPSGLAGIAISAAEDGKGNRMAPFSVAGALRLDTQVPAVIETSPVAGTTSVAAGPAAIAITFSEPLDPQSITSTNFRVLRGSASLAQLTAPQWDADSRTVTLRPAAELLPGTEYSVQVGAPVRDLFGNRLGNTLAWSFRTEVPEVLSVTPSGEIEADPLQLAAVFSAPIDAGLLDSAGVVSVTRDGSAAPLRPGTLHYDASDHRLSFELEAGIRPGSAYTVTVSGLVGGALRLQRAGDYGWSFQTRIPELLESSPQGAADSTAGEIRARFSGALETELLSEETVQVFREGEVTLLRPGSLRFDEATHTLSFAVATGLLAGSRYEVVLSGALAGARRVQGEGDFSWRFQTPVPVLVSTVPAADSSALGTTASALEAVFDQALDVRELSTGSVSLLANGVEIAVGEPGYNPATRTLRVPLVEELRAGTAYEVRLAASLGGPQRTRDYAWRFSTAVPQLVSVSPDSAATDVAISLEAAIAEFSVPVDEDQAVAANFVMLEEGTAVPLRADDPLILGAGRYAFAPRDGWRVGSRYTVRIAASVRGALGGTQDVSWSFSTAVPDTVQVFPAAADTAVLPSQAAITATFDVPLDVAALKAAGGAVLRQGGQAVGLTEVVYDPDTRTVALQPESPLRAGTAYQVSLSAAIGGPLRRREGPFVWDFSTRIPAVLGTDPAPDGEVGVGVRRLAVRFSGPVDPDLLTPENFQLRRGGQQFTLDPGGFDYDASTFTVRYPSTVLLSGSQYTALVRARVTGPLGADHRDHVWSFRTEVPEVVDLWPSSGQDGVPVAASSIRLTFSQPVASQDRQWFEVLARSLDDSTAPTRVVPVSAPSVRDSAGTVILSFAPSAGFSPFTQYQITIAPAVFGELATEPYSWSFTTAARLADATNGGVIRNGDGSVILYFPPNAVAAGGAEVSIRELAAAETAEFALPGGVTPISPSYQISGGAVDKPVSLTMRYTAAQLGDRDPLRLRIFAARQGAWRRVGGVVDPGDASVRTAVDAFGVFALCEDAEVVIGRSAVDHLDCQPRAFVPTGARGKAETDISFELRTAAVVTVRVYNAAGRLERVICRDRQLPPGRVSLQWDGRDRDADWVASGLYIIVVDAGEARSAKTVAVVR